MNVSRHPDPQTSLFMNSNPSGERGVFRSAPTGRNRHAGSHQGHRRRGAAGFLWLALALSVAAQPPPGPQPQADPPPETRDPLSTLNAAFREAYAGLRAEVMAAAGPVLIQCGDTMVLVRGGVRTEAPALTARYHELKSVSHVPLTLYVMLVSGADTRLDDTRLGRLREYRSLLAAGRDSIDGRGFEPDQRARQYRILDCSLDLIDTTLRNGAVTQAELHTYTRGLREDILANAREAAEDQLATMDRQFKAWQALMTPEERRQLRVAVSSVHMARVGNLAMQYFSAALEEPFEGRFEEETITDGDSRVIFAESVFDEQEILKAVGTHAVDAQVGDSFFEDPQRMHRDLLADATEQIIRARFGIQPSCRAHAPQATHDHP